jgi:hypothetical protein
MHPGEWARALRNKALLCRVALRDDIQLRYRELSLVERQIRSRGIAGVNLLVFGLGNDAALWARLNACGRTVFLEDDAHWISRIAARWPRLETHRVHYHTTLGQWRELIAQPARLALALPDEVARVAWDVILVDGPAGWHGGCPGRMQSIYMASVLVAPGGAVLVHDAEREVEASYSARYLGAANRVARALGRATLECYRQPHSAPSLRERVAAGEADVLRRHDRPGREPVEIGLSAR